MYKTGLQPVTKNCGTTPFGFQVSKSKKIQLDTKNVLPGPKNYGKESKQHQNLAKIDKVTWP